MAKRRYILIERLLMASMNNHHGIERGCKKKRHKKEFYTGIYIVS